MALESFRVASLATWSFDAAHRDRRVTVICRRAVPKLPEIVFAPAVADQGADGRLNAGLRSSRPTDPLALVIMPSI